MPWIRRTSGLTILALILIWSAVTHAQSSVTTGVVQGVVVDADGAGLAGAVVEASNPDTGFKRQTLTDRDGRYTVSLLPPAVYDIQAHHSDLKPETRRGVVVSLGSRVTLEFQIQTAVFKGEVVVTADAPIVETTNSGATSSVSDTSIANLPLNGRDFGELVLLTPGSVAGRGSNNVAAEVRGTITGVNIGARSIQNSFNIDGSIAQSTFFGNERGGGFTPFTFSQAAIREFQVIRSTANMRHSAGGGVVNAITKSGTNQLHGEAFGWYRDEHFDGANALGEEADEFQQIQYGFTLGGPIVRDRLHYFASFDTEDLEIPTFRAFDFFPAGREDDWEAVTGLDWDREVGQVMRVIDARVFLLKLDWQLAQSHLLSARYNTQSLPEAANVLVASRTSGWSRNGSSADSYDSFVANLNSVVTDALLNEALVQYSLEEQPRSPNVTSIPETWINQDVWGIFGQWYFLPNNLEERHWQIVDNVSYYLGDHALAGGLNFDFVSYDDMFMRFNGGFYGYNTWNDFLDGRTPYNYIQSFSNSEGRTVFNQNYYSGYLQDEWRATPDLTVGLGVRYDFQDHDQPSTSNPLYPLTGQIPNDGDNFSLRGGFAWDLSGDGKSVVRGGFGNFFDSIPAILDARIMLQNGVNIVQVEQLCWWVETCPSYPDRWASIGDIPPDARPDITVIDPNFENPETVRLWLGYEREILNDLAVGIDLTYSRTRDLVRKQDQNLVSTDERTVDGRTVYRHGTVYPDIGSIVMYRSDAHADFRSIILTAHKRLSKQWFLDASYTWAEARDNDSNERSTSMIDEFPEDQYNLDAEWGPSDFDVRHKFVVSGGVFLPHGFSISGYVFVRSGFPYSAGNWTDLNGDGYTESERAVVETEPGVFYHYPRNTFRQGWFTTTNLRLAKSFRLGKQLELDLIAEVFNLFDRANWYTTRRNLSWGCLFLPDGEWVPCGTSGSFGEKNIPGRPRQFQLGIKLQF